jgi:DNA invertase Pin-like site-specific DNA recombinase
MLIAVFGGIALNTLLKASFERVIAGMREAAAKGTKSGNPIGRPRVDAETERAIRQLPRGGTGINKTAATVGVGTATVQRVRAEMGPFESEAAA